MQASAIRRFRSVPVGYAVRATTPLCGKLLRCEAPLVVLLQETVLEDGALHPRIKWRRRTSAFEITSNYRLRQIRIRSRTSASGRKVRVRLPPLSDLHCVRFWAAR